MLVFARNRDEARRQSSTQYTCNRQGCRRIGSRAFASSRRGLAYQCVARILASVGPPARRAARWPTGRARERRPRATSIGDLSRGAITDLARCAALERPLEGRIRQNGVVKSEPSSKTGPRTMPECGQKPPDGFEPPTSRCLAQSVDTKRVLCSCLLYTSPSPRD